MGARLELVAIFDEDDVRRVAVHLGNAGKEAAR